MKARRMNIMFKSGLLNLMTTACQTISLPRPVCRVKRTLMIMKKSTNLLFHLKLRATVKTHGGPRLTITGQKEWRGPLYARSAKMACAKRNGRTISRTTVLLTTHIGLPFRLTACQEPPPPLMFMSLLLLRKPSVNPLSMKCIRILLMKARTLNTNQKIMMTARAATMTPSTSRECAIKVRTGFLNTNAKIKIYLKLR